MNNTLGLFGKIPTQGDFIERNLQRSFSLQWDDWLQRCMASSREQLGDNWLDTYLISPIWRFCLSAGAVDSLAWAGILMPSVDSVGRYFPLTVAQPIAGNNNLFEFMVRNAAWYTSLENVALKALHGEVNADGLIQELGGLPAATECPSMSSPRSVRLANGWVNHTDTSNVAATYSQLLHQTLTPHCKSQSLWWSGQSQIMTPTCLHTQGLPAPDQFSALLNDHWETDHR